MGPYLVHDNLIYGLKIEKCPSPINDHGLIPGLIWYQGHVIKVRGLRWESVLDFSRVPHLFTILDRIGLSYLQLARERSHSEKGQRHRVSHFQT